MPHAPQPTTSPSEIDRLVARVVERRLPVLLERVLAPMRVQLADAHQAAHVARLQLDTAHLRILELERQVDQLHAKQAGRRKRGILVLPI